MAKSKQVFYVNLRKPWRPIITVDCEIIICEKLVWAVDCHGARRLLGASAFITLPSADRARFGALKRATLPVVASVAPKAFEAAKFELAKYEQAANDQKLKQRRLFA